MSQENKRNKLLNIKKYYDVWKITQEADEDKKIDESRSILSKMWINFSDDDKKAFRKLADSYYHRNVD